MAHNIKALPSFLGIGASRSGTTAIYDYMKRHSDIFVPEEKELHYFTYFRLKNSISKTNMVAFYRNHFKKAHSYTSKGEISPSYLWFPDTAQNIFNFLGPIKIIVILRNPVERAISDFQYSWKYGINKVDIKGFVLKGIEDLNQKSLKLTPFSPSAVLWKGFYSKQIEPYIRIFGKKRVQILLFDDLVDDKQKLKKQLCDFLHVTNYDDLSFIKKNRRPMKKVVPDNIRSLLAEFYQREIDKCAELIDRDLSHWLS